MATPALRNMVTSPLYHFLLQRQIGIFNEAFNDELLIITTWINFWGFFSDFIWLICLWKIEFVSDDAKSRLDPNAIWTVGDSFKYHGFDPDQEKSRDPQNPCHLGIGVGWFRIGIDCILLLGVDAHFDESV